MRQHPELFCYDLPTTPRPNLGRVLVTGGSGYIGGRLTPELIARGYQVRVMDRGNPDSIRRLHPLAEVVVADALGEGQLTDALTGVSVAYYLIHSLFLGPDEFESADIQAARNFARAARQCGVKRIIYLGGLGDMRHPLSPHLRSRIEVSDELNRSGVPVTILRAAVIIGSGSASYELIHNTVKRLPVIVIPRWADNQCQPISIRDVIKYLVGVLETPTTSRMSYDIGGPDVLSYVQMMEVMADVLGKRRKILLVPFSLKGIYSYILSLITPVPNTIVRCLVEGLINDVVCRDRSVREILKFEPIPYREALVRALTREERDSVYTRWSDAYPPAHELAIKLHDLGGRTKYRTLHSTVSTKSKSSIFRSLCKIGGKEGWFYNNWMWRLRGAIDKLLLGVGSSRGRKSHMRLNVNDVVDFWRIEDIQEDRRLLLRAEMKMPGRAWLEFSLKDQGAARELTVAAYYDTSTTIGTLYWYVFLPFHHFIFKHLIDEIAKRS